MAIVFAVLFFVLTGLIGIAILNAFAFPRLQHRSCLDMPLVSILIPARDEAAVIAQTLHCLLTQDYPRFEILLLDDHSHDDTVQLALDAAAGDPRLRLVHSRPLPKDWLGKNWACHQLSQLAAGDIWIFTDADVHWQPGALSAIAMHFQAVRPDLLTVWPQQITQSWTERLVVPLISFSVNAYLPILAVHYIPWRSLTAVNGQCLVFRPAAYRQIGGHSDVRSSVVDDMSLGWNIKGAGLRLRLVESDGMLQTRMYHNWAQVQRGFAKNILAGHNDSVLLLLFSTFFHWSLFLFPWLWLLLGWIRPGDLYPWGPLILTAMGILLRALTAWVSRQRLWDAIFMPVSTILMTIIAAQALWWRKHGGLQWKGRILSGTASPSSKRGQEFSIRKPGDS